MITHSFTVAALVQELDILLRGATIVELYSQRKSELILAIDPVGASRSAVVVSIDPVFNYLYLRQGVLRARKNSVDLFHEVVGTTIERITVGRYDRAVAFEIAGGLTILCQLYSTAASNIVLVDRDKTIRESFKHREELRGRKVPPSEVRFAERLLDDEDMFRNTMRRDQAQQVLVALKRTVPVLGT